LPLSLVLLPVARDEIILALGRHPLIVRCTAAGPVGLSRLLILKLVQLPPGSHSPVSRPGTASASANLRLDVRPRLRRAGFDEAIIDLASRRRAPFKSASPGSDPGMSLLAAQTR
jgi:hypothetical protein